MQDNAHISAHVHTTIPTAVASNNKEGACSTTQSPVIQWQPCTNNEIPTRPYRLTTRVCTDSAVLPSDVTPLPNAGWNVLHGQW